MCQVYFCGIGVQHRCVAVRLASAHPHGMSDIGDLIQSTEVYECFDGNAVEVEIMLDYLGTQHISPRHIYGEVSVSLYGTRNNCRFSNKLWIDRAAYPVATARICATD